MFTLETRQTELPRGRRCTESRTKAPKAQLRSCSMLASFVIPVQDEHILSESSLT